MNFLEELLVEVELKEEARTEAYFDLLLLQVQQLRNQIAYNFHEAEKECSMINNFIMQKNVQLQEKVRWLEIKLEGFIRERKEKTIDLTHGILKYHKKPDKVEITDMEVFLTNAKPELLTIIPEQVKPDINKIKAFIKQRVIPKGVTVTEGKEEFTYKLKEKEEENGRKKEIRTTVEPTYPHRIAV
ncbi:MAG: host-nuclease inhibitor Gam family protein [Ignavibacteriaceae bacterium]|jgi:phage host-nuclease inhibitor protein Gam|nr:host-nuclease inhibitor Gam family protein [Ignavibacteriaceae bacterium]